MKKTFYYFLLLAGTSSLYAQTFVGTTVEKKKPLLEKFTGIDCGACPGGDAEIQDLKTQYGDNLNVFAHHTFSETSVPNYEATFSGDIAAQSFNGSGSYPGGSVNRIQYEDWQQNAGGSAMLRSYWSGAVALEADVDAYVNVGAKLKYDVEFNKFIVDVEIYYTGEPAADQRLNVALVQDHILGPQVSGGAGDNYEHNHMLRDLLTGASGESLPNAEDGAFITKSYELVIPDAYGPVSVIPEDMEVVVYITEGQGNIANSNHAAPEPFVNYTLNPSIKDDGISVCGSEVEPILELTNYGTSNITDLEITYSINGIEDTYNWSGDIATFDIETITLPGIPFTSLTSNTFTAEITNTNNQGADDADYNNTVEMEFGQTEELNANSHLLLKLDGYGSDITWRIVDEDGAEHYTGGPYEDGNVDLISESFDLTEDKCYRFEIKDSEGNGLEGGQNNVGTYYPAGYFKFMSGSYVKQDTDFGNRDEQFFSIDVQTVSTAEIELNKIKIFPNPTSSSFHIEVGMQASGSIEYTLTDVLGKTVVVHIVDGQGGKNGILVDHDLPPGIYHLNVNYEGKSSYAKLVIQ